MFIVNIIDQHRRDFSANIECESCGHKDILKGGYDDDNYHQNVMPNIKCKNCGESTNSAGKDAVKRQTKYPEGYQI